MEDDTSPSPLDSIDDDGPLRDDELRRVRKLLRDDDRATWARRQIRVIAPWLISIMVGLWQLAEWASKHIHMGK